MSDLKQLSTSEKRESNNMDKAYHTMNNYYKLKIRKMLSTEIDKLLDRLSKTEYKSYGYQPAHTKSIAYTFFGCKKELTLLINEIDFRITYELFIDGKQIMKSNERCCVETLIFTTLYNS